MSYSTLLLIILPMAGFWAAYHLYGRYLARKIFRLDDSRVVPSEELKDGCDYVPTRRGIIFGHHYTSIAGTGPIIGPAIGVIWGWLPALLWVVFGSIFMGAVHDLGALVVSLRNQGRSISDITRQYINGRVRLIFFLIVFFELWIVIAVFAIVIGGVFVDTPGSVFPIWMEIPIAVVLGYAIYRRGASVKLATAIAVLAMYVTVPMGHIPWMQFAMPTLGPLGPIGLWCIVLFIYAFFASTLRVTTLLQPRDYINAWQLYIAMGLLGLGAIVSAALGRADISAPVVRSPVGAPSMWPILFITIACGAISGFHALVASGTTPKQISKESDALFVGYGSMLLEGVLAVLVIVSVVAGLSMASRGTGMQWAYYYGTWADAQQNALKAVLEGSSSMIGTLGIPHVLARIIMGVFIASFAGTTLDTATRIQRYVVTELAVRANAKPLANRYVATAIAVGASAALAFASGASMKGMKLWPMFGAVNQLLAALALIVVTIYLKRRTNWGWVISAVPCLFMLVTTNYAVWLNETRFWNNLYNAQTNALNADQAMLLAANGLIQLLALWMTVEAAVAFFTAPRETDISPVPASAGLLRS